MFDHIERDVVNPQYQLVALAGQVTRPGGGVFAE